MFANTAKTVLANTTLRDSRLADAARLRLRAKDDEYNIKAQNVFIVDDDAIPPSRRRKRRSQAKSPAKPQSKTAPKTSTQRSAARKRKPTRKSTRKSTRKKRTSTCSAATKPTQRPKRVRRRRQDVPEETFYSTKLRRGLRDAAQDDAVAEPAEYDHLMDDALHDDEHCELSDCQYHHDTDNDTLADKEPTTTQAATINLLNERFIKFEGALRQKYRAFFSPRAERGYVVRKFVGNTEKIEHYGDAMLKYRPIGIGGKTLKRVWKARHGFDWSDFASKTKTNSEVESLISKHAWETAKSTLNKAEAKALRGRTREETRKAQQAAKHQAKQAQKRAERADNHADVQAKEAQQAEQRAKQAQARAKKQPTPRNRTAAQRAQTTATIERQEAAEARERADEQALRASVLEKLAAKYA